MTYRESLTTMLYETVVVRECTVFGNRAYKVY
jgi:hypothetical protein